MADRDSIRYHFSLTGCPKHTQNGKNTCDSRDCSSHVMGSGATGCNISYDERGMVIDFMRVEVEKLPVSQRTSD